MRITITGGSSRDLNLPEDLSSKEWNTIVNKIKNQLVEMEATEVLIGLDEGFPMAGALAVIKLKEEKYPIKLTCALTGNIYNFFNPINGAFMRHILTKSDKIVGMLNSYKILTELKIVGDEESFALFKWLKKDKRFDGPYDEPYKKSMARERRKYLFDNTDTVLICKCENARVSEDLSYATSRGKNVINFRRGYVLESLDLMCKL